MRLTIVEILFVAMGGWVSSVQAAGPACPVRNCPRSQNVEICFRGYEPLWARSLRNLAYNRTCGPNGIIFDAETPAQLRADIQELAGKCIQITKLTFLSHGSPGRIGLFSGNTGIGVDNLKDLVGTLGCWTAPKAEIVATGCSIGQGCVGDNLLYQMARQLLPRGGTVRASTAISLTVLPGLVPISSSDGNKAQVTYNPWARPDISWQNRSESTGQTTPRQVNNQQCLEYIQGWKNYLGRSPGASTLCPDPKAYREVASRLQRLSSRYRRAPANRFQSPQFLSLATEHQELSDAFYNNVCGAAAEPGESTDPTRVRGRQ